MLIAVKVRLAVRQIREPLLIAATFILSVMTPAFSVPAVPSGPSLPTRFDVASSVPENPFAAYLERLQFKIQENWRPEGGEQLPASVYSFEVNANGTVSRVKLKQSSGDKRLDKIAKSAILESSPFPPLVNGIDKITINYTFDTGLPKPVSSCTLADSVTGHLLVRGAIPRDVELGSYVTKLQSRILECWKSEPVEKVEFVQLQGKLDKSGKLVDLKPLDPSNQPMNTASAIEAVRKAEPFEPVELPESEDVYVSLTFQKMPPPKSAGDYKPIPPAQPQFDPVFASYIEMAQYKVRSEWHPVNGARSKQVVVGFTVNSDGTASNVSAEKSSGVKSVDEAAIKAVLAAAPFGKLPKADRDSLHLQFTFEDRADPSKQRVFELKSTAPYSVIIATPPVRRRRF